MPDNEFTIVLYVPGVKIRFYIISYSIILATAKKFIRITKCTTKPLENKMRIHISQQKNSPSS